MKLLSRFLCWGLLTLPVLAEPPPAPLVNAKAVRERYEKLTDADFDRLREARVLMASKSLGLNLAKGLEGLARADPRAALNTAYARYDVEKGGMEAVPKDAFREKRFVHFMATRWPAGKRYDQMAEFLRPPWNFRESVDVMLVLTVGEELPFAEYQRRVDALQREFPGNRFIVTTFAVNSLKDFPERNALNEEIRRHYTGKLPIFDIAALLSDDDRNGARMLPEYSKDATGVHPNQGVAMTLLAKGLLLSIHETLRWQPAVGGAAAPVAGEPAAAAVLPAGHPEMRAVRAILDHNGLQKVPESGVVQIRDGHVVVLSIQEMGVREIPDAIVLLPRLERLQVYSDPESDLPRLQRVSPALGQLTALRELTLNHNQLRSLPDTLTRLRALESLSVADNPLDQLSPGMREWIRKLDPESLPKTP
jgi:hypothetical protein